MGRTTADQPTQAASVVGGPPAILSIPAASLMMASLFNDRIQDVSGSSLGALQSMDLVTLHA